MNNLRNSIWLIKSVLNKDCIISSTNCILDLTNIPQENYESDLHLICALTEV